MLVMFIKQLIIYWKFHYITNINAGEYNEFLKLKAIYCIFIYINE